MIFNPYKTIFISKRILITKYFFFDLKKNYVINYHVIDSVLFLKVKLSLFNFNLITQLKLCWVIIEYLV